MDGIILIVVAILFFIQGFATAAMIYSDRPFWQGWRSVYSLEWLRKRK